MASESVIQASNAVEIQILSDNCEKPGQNMFWTTFEYLISNLDEFCLRLGLTCAFKMLFYS